MEDLENQKISRSPMWLRTPAIAIRLRKQGGMKEGRPAPAAPGLPAFRLHSAAAALRQSAESAFGRGENRANQNEAGTRRMLRGGFGRQRRNRSRDAALVGACRALDEQRWRGGINAVRKQPRGQSVERPHAHIDDGRSARIADRAPVDVVWQFAVMGVGGDELQPARLVAFGRAMSARQPPRQAPP